MNPSQQQQQQTRSHTFIYRDKQKEKTLQRQQTDYSYDLILSNITQQTLSFLYYKKTFLKAGGKKEINFVFLESLEKR